MITVYEVYLNDWEGHTDTTWLFEESARKRVERLKEIYTRKEFRINEIELEDSDGYNIVEE